MKKEENFSLFVCFCTCSPIFTATQSATSPMQEFLGLVSGAFSGWLVSSANKLYWKQELPSKTPESQVRQGWGENQNALRTHRSILKVQTLSFFGTNTICELR